MIEYLINTFNLLLTNTFHTATVRFPQNPDAVLLLRCNLDGRVRSITLIFPTFATAS